MKATGTLKAASHHSSSASLSSSFLTPRSIMLRSSSRRLVSQQQRRRSRITRTPGSAGAVEDTTLSLSSWTSPILCFHSLGCKRSQQQQQQQQQRLYSSLCLANIGTAYASSAVLRPFHHVDHQHHHQQQRHKSVFVSRHNQSLPVTAKAIIEHCENVKLIRSSQDYRTTATHVILKECPFCPKPTLDKADNLYKLYLHSGTGAYFCHRCGAGGSWFDWKLKLSPGNALGEMVDPSGYNYNNNNQNNPSPSSRTATAKTANTATSDRPSYFVKTEDNNSSNDNLKSKKQDMNAPLPMPASRLQALYIEQLLRQEQQQLKATTTTTSSSSSNTNNKNALQYLTQTRGLESTVLKKYGVGCATYKFPSNDNQWIEAECVTFPWIMSVTDIQYQEQLRGAKFHWPSEPTSNSNSSRSSSSSNQETIDGSANQERDANKPQQQKPQQSTQKSMDSTFLTRRIKARSIANKSWQRLDPPGGGWGLFGYHTIPDDATEVVVTEGEYDAMAVWQATGRPAVSLPNGCRSLPVEVLPLLERFDKIYLWMDNDAPGQEGAEQFAKKLGLERTFFVRPTLQNCQLLASNAATSSTTTSCSQILQEDHPLDDNDECLDDDDDDEETEHASEDEAPPPVPKDANDALRDGYDLEAIIADAKRKPHERITTFRDLRDDVLHEIMHPDKYVGTPITSLPGLTSIVKGLRRGELTVLTGPTGSGKTTYLGQMSLDLVEQDVNVLWGSFEIKNTRLMHKLLQQFARQPLPTGDPTMEAQLNALADRFEKLPFTFMKFHGGSDVDDVLDAMDYAVYVNDVEHIILDNMQFMVSLKGLGSRSTFDKFDVQDVAIEKFRKFATERDVHVTLVVHPRKEQEHSQLSISSIYGSAKATQEADTVLILQNNGQKKFMEVKKNRFNGALGTSPLHFDRKSCRYSEIPVEAPHVNKNREDDSVPAKPRNNVDPWKEMFA